jgi:hypothetical protein
MKREKKPRKCLPTAMLDFEQMASKWSKPFVKRSDVKEFSSGLIAPKTLANLAALGEGPPYYHVSGYAVYQTTDLTDWFIEKYHPYPPKSV